MTWGISRNSAEHNYSELHELSDFTDDHLKPQEKDRLKVAKFFYPTRGPYNWMKDWLNYAKLSAQNEKIKVRIYDFLKANSDKITMAEEIFHEIVSIYNSSFSKHEHLYFDKTANDLSFTENKFS